MAHMLRKILYFIGKQNNLKHNIFSTAYIQMLALGNYKFHKLQQQVQ